MRCKFAELRARDGARTGKAKLHVFGKIPGNRPGRQEIVIVEISARRWRQAEQRGWLNKLLAIFIAHACVQRHAIDWFDFEHGVSGMHLQTSGKGCRAEASGGFSQQHIVAVNIIVAQQVIDALLCHSRVERRGRLELKIAADGIAAIVIIGIARRKGQRIFGGQLIGHIRATGPNGIFELAECDKGILPGRTQVVHIILKRLTIDIAVRPLIRRIALRLGIGAAQIER